MRPCRQKRPENVRPKQTEAKVPSEEMRKRAREWLYNADHPNECASQGEVDDLATLLDEVRREGFAGGLEEAARIVAAHCCVSTCCDAQPGAVEAKALAACVRKRADREAIMVRCDACGYRGTRVDASDCPDHGHCHEPYACKGQASCACGCRSCVVRRLRERGKTSDGTT